MMKWILAAIVCGSLFIAGALFGIEKNSEKLEDTQTVVVQEKEKRGTDDQCAPPSQDGEYPWIVQVAGGIGEGVAATFNGIVLILSEFIHSGSA